MQYKDGDVRNGTKVLPFKDRKTLLFLSDDMRMSSGIATMTKELVTGLVHRYNFVQLGAAVEHPEQGKELDLNKDIQDKTGVDDAFVRIIPWKGYGDANILRQLITRYQPSGIIHFTDPRYWKFLYAIEAEIRDVCPIMYYTIWDNVGTEPHFRADPSYNKSYYGSCDGLFGISKQTFGMVSRLMKDNYGDEINIINTK